MKANGLYDPRSEHDACGVGFVLNLNGKAEHRIVEKGIEVLANLLHRGATGADENTGDGAGLLIQLPDAFFRAEAERIGFALPEAGRYGVGSLFLPQNAQELSDCKSGLQRILVEEGLVLLGWREVPVDPMAVGDTARSSMPSRRCAGAEASGGAQARRARAGNQGSGWVPELLCLKLVLPDGGLQGHDDCAAGAEVLPGSDG